MDRHIYPHIAISLLTLSVLAGCSRAISERVVTADTDPARLERGTFHVATDEPQATAKIVEGPFVLTDFESRALSPQYVLYVAPTNEGCGAMKVMPKPSPGPNGQTTMPPVPSGAELMPPGGELVRENTADLHGSRYLVPVGHSLCVGAPGGFVTKSTGFEWFHAELRGSWAGFRPYANG
jgi:hypothetical protein